MKIREGFVSNSSSTSFTFCFKGGTLDRLFELMRKYKSHFNLSYHCYGNDEGYNIHVEDVISSIEQLGVTNGIWGFRIITMVDLLDQQTRHLADCIRYNQEDKDRNKDISWRDHYYEEEITKVKINIQETKKLIKKSFDTAIIIGFGDNSGDVSGGAVGYTMDYEGRMIRINEPDFVVTTEQNR